MSIAEVIEMPRRESQPVAEELVLTAPEPPEPLAVVIDRHIQQALAFCGGNKSKTARLLGIDRRTLYRRLEKGTEECPNPPPQPLPRSQQYQASTGRVRSHTRP